MTVKVLDAKGRELEKGSRVNVYVIAGEARTVGVPHTVVRLQKPHEGIVSVGLYHGSLADYQPTFCIPYLPAEETNGGDFKAADLELIDPPTSKQEASK